MSQELNSDLARMLLRRRPFPMRFIRSYRGWRSFGLSRLASLRGAWRINRLLSRVWR
jgi:hypothetical protein